MTYQFIHSGFNFTAVEWRLALIPMTAGVAIARVLLGSRKRAPSQAILERKYAEYLEGAFQDAPKAYKRLIKAVKLFNIDRCGKAVAILKKLEDECVTTRDHLPVYMFTALCYDERGVYTLAEDYYRQVLQCDPGSAAALVNLGIICSRTGDYETALQFNQKAIKADPADPNPYNNIAVVYLDMEALDEAIEYANMALERKANMVPALHTLALAYTTKGDREMAERYYRQSVLNDSASARLLRQLMDEISG